MAYPSTRRLSTVHLFCSTTDISTAGSRFVRVPFRCKVVLLSCTIAAAITNADNTVTGKIGPAGASGTAITGGAITVTQAGSAAGLIFTATPTALNFANAGDNIEFAYTGSTTACPANFEAVIEPA